MGRIILVYGVIAGVTVAILMRIAMMLFPEGGTGGMNAAIVLAHTLQHDRWRLSAQA